MQEQEEEKQKDGASCRYDFFHGDLNISASFKIVNM